MTNSEDGAHWPPPAGPTPGNPTPDDYHGDLPTVPPPGGWNAGTPSYSYAPPAQPGQSYEYAPPAAPGVEPPPSSYPPGGYPPGGYAMGPPPQPSTSTLAVIAFIVGLLSFFLPFLGGLLAIILGIIAVVRIGNSNGLKTGRVFGWLGVGLGVLTIAIWTLVVTSDSFQEGFQEGLEEGLEDNLTSNIIEIGDCLAISTAESTNFEVAADDVVSCALPHSAEYVGFFDLPYPDGADYPGVDPVFEEGLAECIEIFDAYTGTDYQENLDLDVLVEYPQTRGWSLFNDREVGCFIVSTDGSELTGSVAG